GVENSAVLDITLGTNTPESVGDYALYDSSCMPLFDTEHIYSGASLSVSDGQTVFASDAAVSCDVSGYSAITTLGNNKARWVSLLEAHDSNGVIVGTVGALLRIFPDSKDKSTWNKTWDDYEATCIAFFGVTSCDILKEGNEALREGFLKLLQVMMDDVYVEYATNFYDIYKNGESPVVTVVIGNSSSEAAAGTAKLEIINRESGETVHSTEKTFTVNVNKSASLMMGWKTTSFDTDFYVVKITLSDSDGIIYDTYESGFAVWDSKVVAAGVNYSYHDNYIYRQNEDKTETAVFTVGVDDGGNIFGMFDQTPLTWIKEMSDRRDSGINLYETLAVLSSEISNESYMRTIDCMMYLAQKYNQIYMLGIAIGANVAMSDGETEKLAKVCAKVAERYKDVPGFIYYLNGDLRCVMTTALNEAFNEYLGELYADDDALRQAWCDNTLSLGSVEIDENFTGSGTGWADMKAYDYNMFRTQRTVKWTTALIDSIRAVDSSEKLILCEFYSYPYEAVDIPTALGKLSYSNIGFFESRFSFPQTLAYSDQRYNGQSLGIGEFGIRTNTLMDLAAAEMHRSVSQTVAQAQFFTVLNNSITLGASHAQLWCWSDETRYIFPWGMKFALDGVKRQLSYNLRNAALFTRLCEPVYESPAVAVLTPDSTRLGGYEVYYAGHYGLVSCLDILQRTNVGSTLTLNDSRLTIPDSVKVIFYPISYNPTDEVIEALTEFVKNGGVLYVSGDISYDEYRKQTKTDRLTALAGVKWEETYFDGTDYITRNSLTYTDGTITRTGSPNIRVSLAGATALYSDTDGNPVVTQYSLGSGKVIFNADPIELYSTDSSVTKDVQLYSYVLSLADVQLIDADSAGVASSLKVFYQALADGTKLYSFFNANTSELKTMTASLEGHDIKFGTPSGQTDLIRIGADGIYGVQFSGAMTVGGTDYIVNNAYAHIYSLDGSVLDKSSCIAVTPVKSGSIKIKTSAFADSIVVTAGTVTDGTFVSYMTLGASVTDGYICFDVPENAVNTVILITTNDKQEKAQARIEALVNGFSSHSMSLITDVSDTSETTGEKPQNKAYLYIIGVVLLLAAAASALVLIMKNKKNKT
ncbi:MAG TPA: beta-galactosidase trimerization domain-containing protein, partial [Bacillota bacterium]|nr:beta-galactosidase trimerization domain-containing protein [Bacillota bacterium]